LEIPVLISTHLIFLQPGDNLMTFAGQLASKGNSRRCGWYVWNLSISKIKFLTTKSRPIHVHAIRVIDDIFWILAYIRSVGYVSTRSDNFPVGKKWLASRSDLQHFIVSRRKRFNNYLTLILCDIKL